MAKLKPNIPPVTDIQKHLANKKISPVYLFTGEDSYSIDTTIKQLTAAVEPYITSDFDKETIYCTPDKDLNDILNVVTAFPLGSEKKLVVLKEFEKIKDRKKLASYVKAPADFTVLIIIQNGDISNPEAEPYFSLLSNGYMFEAKELKGKALADWVESYCTQKGKFISAENAALLVETVGDNRALVEMQLQKMFTFLGENKEITFEIVKDLATELKEYTIFDLQNAIGKKDKKEALKIANNMLEKGSELVFILAMLTRYFTGLAQIPELTASKMPDQAAARIVGTHPFYYSNYKRARDLFPDKRLNTVIKALLKADISIKTSSIDEKSILTILMAEILR